MTSISEPIPIIEYIWIEYLIKCAKQKYKSVDTFELQNSKSNVFRITSLVLSGTDYEA